MARAGTFERFPLPLRTPRLLLRLPSAADVPELRRLFRDPRTARAVGAPLHSREEMRDPARLVARTRREFRNGAHLSLSVILRSDDRCIGRVGLRELDWRYRKVGSLSYWIAPSEWGRGYATEASWYLCDRAFRELRLRRIGSQALEPNRPSRRVLERLGFVREGRERAAVRVRGRTIDMLLFGLLAGELVDRPPAAPGAGRRAPLRSRPSPRASRGGRSSSRS